jgi:hypothetical protein
MFNSMGRGAGETIVRGGVMFGGHRRAVVDLDIFSAPPDRVRPRLRTMSTTQLLKLLDAVKPAQRTEATVLIEETSKRLAGDAQSAAMKVLEGHMHVSGATRWDLVGDRSDSEALALTHMFKDLLDGEISSNEHPSEIHADPKHLPHEMIANLLMRSEGPLAQMYVAEMERIQFDDGVEHAYNTLIGHVLSRLPRHPDDTSSDLYMKASWLLECCLIYNDEDKAAENLEFLLDQYEHTLAVALKLPLWTSGQYSMIHGRPVDSTRRRLAVHLTQRAGLTGKTICGFEPTAFRTIGVYTPGVDLPTVLHKLCTKCVKVVDAAESDRLWPWVPANETAGKDIVHEIVAGRCCERADGSVLPFEELMVEVKGSTSRKAASVIMERLLQLKDWPERVAHAFDLDADVVALMDDEWVERALAFRSGGMESVRAELHRQATLIRAA